MTPVQIPFTKEEHDKAIKGNPMPTMVQEGYFQNVLCRHFHNCTHAAGDDSGGVPRMVHDGLLTKLREAEDGYKRAEVNHLRAADTALSMLSHAEEHRKVCAIVEDLREVSEFIYEAQKADPDQVRFKIDSLVLRQRTVSGAVGGPTTREIPN